MTIYCEDPHDSWFVRVFPDAPKDHAGRGKVLLGAIFFLVVFWSLVGWGLSAVI